MGILVYSIGVALSCLGAMLILADILKIHRGWLLGALLLLIGIIVAFLGDKIFKKFSVKKRRCEVGLLTPIYPRARHRCPFYGFQFFGDLDTFIDSGGNQCAANLGAYGPCQMEFGGRTPNWSECPFNEPKNQKRFENIKDSCKVYPKEFGPDGLPFGQWLEYAMNQKLESVGRD